MRITLEDLKLDYGYVEKRIIEFIRDYFEKTGVNRAVVGISGGVDSTVTAFLTVRALGSGKVTALIMPDSKVTPSRDLEDALKVVEILGIKKYQVDIANILESYRKNVPFFDANNKIALGNLRARIRMTLLYYYANLNNALVVGTGDKSELLIGYFTKYGDGGVDILPIGDLYKTQVRQLAIHLGIPKDIAEKPSSPALWPGQTAEGELGMSYSEVDLVLYSFFDRKIEMSRIPQVTGVDEWKVKAILERVSKTSHKRNMPPIPKISGRTLGADLIMPQYFSIEEIGEF
ncbi:MAG: NAD(+) synthetase [Thermoprotei archaeon]|nr:MAG: NAD(+) synthetase [Thermoprotei archaeon]